MALEFDPKRDFIRDNEARLAHAQIVSNPLVHRTIAIAIAEMHARGLGPTDMAGVNGFVWTWLNLSEENPIPRSMPTKHLKSYGQPPTISES